jgi:hypothetical protein
VKATVVFLTSLLHRRVAGPLAVVGAIVVLKAVLLALDPTIRLYLGDSIAFLWGAMDDGRLPDDRSFTY